MKQFYTYLHCKPDLTPFYVGKGHGKRSHDFRNGRNKHHKSIVAKYGVENIIVLVFKKDSEESAFTSEIRLIRMLRQASFDLANYTNGGDGAAGRINSPATKAKRSKSLMGNKNNLGKKHSVETRKKMSEAGKGRKLSLKHIEKLRKPKTQEYRASMIGNKRALGKKYAPRTPEHCAKLGASNKGKNKGKPWSAKRRAAQCKV